MGGPLRVDPSVLRRRRLQDLQRTERLMVRVRWVAVAFIGFQVLVYDNMPQPRWSVPVGLAIAGVLAVANVAATALSRRIESMEGARNLALAMLGIDVLVSSALVWQYTFDQDSVMWAILFVVPLEGAVRFRLAGAFGTWGAVTVLYTMRELWGSRIYDYDFLWWSVSFRMGINLLIALVAGFMAADLVRQRASTEAALVELERVDQLRRHLVSTLAHDVRGPLTAIRGALSVLEARPDIDPRRRDRLLRMAQSQAGRMEYLAADLLDLARLEEGRLRLDTTEVPLREAVQRALEFADAEGLFDLDVPPTMLVRADARRLEQIIVNLAGNALRHGAPPFAIEAAVDGVDVCIVVCDGGHGIPSQRLEQLFRPWQADERDSGSLGLGLWIVRMLTEAQGGEVAYGRSDDMTRFEVRLPLAGANQPA